MLPLGFKPTEELPGGHCSRVYANENQVLKVPFQGEELQSGFRASLVLESRGGPKVFASELDTGSVLMERIRPGTTLSDAHLPESEAIAIFIQAIKKLRNAPTDGMLPVEQYFTGTHPLLKKLIDTSPPPVFLHGDLHHGNILAGPSGSWITIDPKGLYGDPNFEAAAFLRNPTDDLGDANHMNALADSRLRILETSFGWDPARMVAWCWLDLHLYSEGRSPDDPWAILESVLASRLSPEFV